MKKSITIQAPRQKVWDAIMSYRESDPSKRKVVSSAQGRAVIEENFPGAPIVGSAKVVYEESERPLERIDYQLLQSDQLSKFRGSWTLSEAGNGNSTVVELTAELDISLPIPFKEQILNAQSGADIDKRLAYVKKTAEE